MPGSPTLLAPDIALKFPGIRPWSCTTPNATRTFSFGYQQKQQRHGQSKFFHFKQLSTAQRRMLRQHSIIVRVGAAGSNSSAEIKGLASSGLSDGKRTIVIGRRTGVAQPGSLAWLHKAQ
ncbi:hypothetical protein QC762_0038910 [Podospora pseudocomata]|uniref:Uncharacterized protein n=1 Tax=Podospora pseudocomata TaxID=2093779 RepID=A0ABR0GLZ3_9PEZI|nr:hypothetical protein QC762_0038910 [Podospora pseudocomata]